MQPSCLRILGTPMLARNDSLLMILPSAHMWAVQVTTPWRKACDKLEGDEVFEALEKVDRLEVWQDHIKCVLSTWGCIQNADACAFLHRYFSQHSCISAEEVLLHATLLRFCQGSSNSLMVHEHIKWPLHPTGEYCQVCITLSMQVIQPQTFLSRFRVCSLEMANDPSISSFVLQAEVCIDMVSSCCLFYRPPIRVAQSEFCV